MAKHPKKKKVKVLSAYIKIWTPESSRKDEEMQMVLESMTYFKGFVTH